MTQSGVRGQPKNTDDNDGSLRGRGCTFLDKTEGIIHKKFFEHRFNMPQVHQKYPQTGSKRNQMNPVLQTKSQNPVINYVIQVGAVGGYPKR